jgi:hypothetical protein
MNLVKNKLKVSHYPQIPGKAFEVEVKDEIQASLIVNTLANQHLWLYENNYIPDYSNAITVSMFDEEENEWTDYWNEEEMMEFDEFEETYLK